MRRTVFATVLFILISVALGHDASAQLAAAPSSDVAQPILQRSLLTQMLRSSGQVFSGTVLNVEHAHSGSSSVLATTNIRLRVDEPIRGVRKGQVLEIREWAGLWQAGERYRPGERVLLFLYPPSKLGLTSPVGHQAGRFLIDKGGNLLPNSGHPNKPIQIHRVIAAIRQAEIK
ncbi:MAG TPA: hypothetical protein VJ731_01820 [Terriglobales bacterium]|nr:hypothetical protein [Terriglobales bacterium]